MKSSFTIAILTLLLVVLGCGLDRLTGKKDEVPTPVPDATAPAGNTTTAPQDTPASTTTTDTATGVSIDNFNKIKLGMSYDEVKSIIGSEGDQTGMQKTSSFESARYQWKNDTRGTINVTFTNGALTYMSQFGLTPAKGTADIDQAKFNKLNLGMSYNEVKDILGSEGELSSRSRVIKTENASYRWKGPNYSSIFLVFRDDKLQNKSQSNLK